jgi:hypothetical protein
MQPKNHRSKFIAADCIDHFFSSLSPLSDRARVPGCYRIKVMSYSLIVVAPPNAVVYETGRPDRYCDNDEASDRNLDAQGFHPFSFHTFKFQYFLQRLIFDIRSNGLLKGFLNFLYASNFPLTLSFFSLAKWTRARFNSYNPLTNCILKMLSKRPQGRTLRYGRLFLGSSSVVLAVVVELENCDGLTRKDCDRCGPITRATM